jgi:outer membrane lipoprotein-sorting protein
MSELGDVLELLHGAHGRYTTARLDARERRRYRLQSEAYERARRRYAQGEAVAISYGPPLDLPEEGESTVRSWFAQPHRFREERVENGRPYIVLGDGTRFWTSSPEWATVVQDGVGWMLVNPSTRVLLDPSALLPLLDLEVGGAATTAGREAIAVRGTPRDNASFDVPLPIGATEHQLLVDAERGVLLRVESLLDGVPFDTLEVTDAAFDEPLDAALFAYKPSPGEEVLRPQDVSPGEAVTVEEAAARASFTVLVPGSLGRGWHTHVLYVRGRERISETVHISLYRDEGMNSVSLRETPPPFESWQLNGTEVRERDGTTLRMSTGEFPRVLVEREGTCVELSSQTYTPDELAELAITLVPAATDRPPLVG